MDCKTARQLLDFLRPADLDRDEAAELKRHLSACADCDALGRAERRLDDHLGRAMRDVPVPAGLRERLLCGLRERRRAVLRRRLAWAARLSAVAAVLLLALLAWWRVGAAHPEKVNLQAAREADFQKYSARDADQVKEWFGQRHVVMAPPRVFDYACLAEFDMATLQGKPVPKLVFQRDPNTRARVFVLSREQFDIPALVAANDDDDSLGRRLKAWESPESPSTAYLVIYEGDLDSLMDPNRPLPH